MLKQGGRLASFAPEPALERIGATITWLSALGTAGYPPATARRLKILNVMAYLIALFTLLYSLEHLLVDYVTFRPVILINLALVAAALLVPLMHRVHEIAGGVLIAVAEFIGIFALASYLGSPSGIHIQYVIGAAAPFFIFGLARMRLILVVVALCLAFHFAVWALFPSPDPAFAANPAFLRSVYITAAVTTFVITAWIVFYAFRLAEQAQAETEALLRTILPHAIADRLKAAPGAVIADSFGAASVLFADMKGFVPIALALGPAGTVELLNRIVREFDALAARHGVEKIKTIGDAYMAAAGVPAAVPDHAPRLVRLGLDMLATIEAISAEIGQPLSLRIGLASGPVMAGVIGTTRITYDVWGNTVNLAARLENAGVPGRVQVSESAKRLIEPAFLVEPRGAIEIKGLGAQEVWLVRGPR
jgi:adenylate cyclase